MASKQPNGGYGGNNNNNPKYMTDFSKALAGEMRILLDEVGKLRDERRQLQYEIAELMTLKAKHSAGGEYFSGWPAPGPMEIPPPEAPPEPPAAIAPAPPAWRTVHKRPERKAKQGKITAPPPPPPPPEPVKMGPAWAQWRPNPLLAPVPAPGASMPGTPNPPRSGLFGPATPPPK